MLGPVPEQQGSDMLKKSLTRTRGALLATALAINLVIPAAEAQSQKPNDKAAATTGKAPLKAAPVRYQPDRFAGRAGKYYQLIPFRLPASLLSRLPPSLLPWAVSDALRRGIRSVVASDRLSGTPVPPSPCRHLLLSRTRLLLRCARRGRRTPLRSDRLGIFRVPRRRQG